MPATIVILATQCSYTVWNLVNQQESQEHASGSEIQLHHARKSRARLMLRNPTSSCSLPGCQNGCCGEHASSRHKGCACRGYHIEVEPIQQRSKLMSPVVKTTVPTTWTIQETTAIHLGKLQRYQLSPAEPLAAVTSSSSADCSVTAYQSFEPEKAIYDMAQVLLVIWYVPLLHRASAVPLMLGPVQSPEQSVPLREPATQAQSKATANAVAAGSPAQ